MSMLRVPWDQLDFDINYVVSWEGKLFTGVAYDLMPDDHVWSETEFLDGREEGVGRSWYFSGQLELETTYRRGGKYGPEREWFESGKLRRETVFEYSIRVKERIWDEQGNIIHDFEIDDQHPSYSRLQLYRHHYD